MKSLLTVVFYFVISFQAFASFVGNDILNRSNVDGASNINFVDTTLVFGEAGLITSWDIWAGRENSAFALQVLRSTGNANEFQIVGENYFSGAGALGSVNLAIDELDQIQVQAGDFIGWWFGSGQGVIDYTPSTSDTVNWKYEFGTHVDLGDSLVFSSGGAREYSVRANVVAVPEPSVLAIFGLAIMGLGFSARKRKFR
jgi:hypothetical protein